MSASNYITNAEREKLFGKFKWTRLKGDAIDIEDGWEKDNITRVWIPQLAGVPSDGGIFKGYVTWNVHAVDQLQRFWADAESQGLMKYVLWWGGSYVARVKRGGDDPSNHAYGTAFDVNVEWNWMGSTPAALGRRGSVVPLVKLAKTHGFLWGGDWGTPDGMHFEVGRIVKYDTPEPADGKLIVDNDTTKPIPVDIRDGVSYASYAAMLAAVSEPEEPKTEKTDDKEKKTETHPVKEVAPPKDLLVPVGQFMASHGRLTKWVADQKKVYAWIR